MADLKLLLLLAITVAASNVCPPSWAGVPKGCVLPNDPYVYFGENVTLECHVLVANRSENLFFSWKNDVNISQDYQRVISPSTLQLNRPILESDNIPLEGVLILCKDSETGDLMGFGQFLRVEYYPRKVDNWTVLIEDWRNLTLTWETGPYINQRDIHLSVRWTTADTDIWMPCSKQSWTSCFLNDSVFNNSQAYHFNITVTNNKRQDSTVTEISLNSEDYVKPAPVSITSAELSSRCVTLQWNHSCPVSRPILYQVAVLVDNSEVTAMTFNTTTGTVCGLHPNTLYTFSVTARSELGGFWSDADVVTNKTHEDKPDRGVNITAGSYHLGACEANMREITIFLKPPDDEYRNGPLHMYTAVFKADDGSPDIKREQLVTHDPTLNISLSCDVDYTLSLSVNNSIGVSPVFVLHIPRLGSIPSPDIVRVSVNGSIVRVLWKVATNVQPLNFTIYWCKGDTTFVHCRSPPSWQLVDGSQRSASLPISADTVSTYLFAVSMTTNKGSSGMKISECVFDVNKAFDSKQKPWIDKVISNPNLGLTVKWSMPVCDHNRLVTNYSVQLCPDDTTQHCVNKTTSSEEKEQMFDMLEEGRNYTVRLQEISLAGLRGPLSDPKFGVPVDSYLKPGWIVFIIVGGLLIVLLIVGYSWKKCRERDPIKMPGIEKNEMSPPPLPIRHMTLEIPEDYQRLSTDSGQGSPGSDLTSSLMPSLNDSGHCDQLTSAQTEMTDVSRSCPDILVLSSNIEHPQEVKDHTEFMSDESDVPPYVVTDVEGGVVNQALVHSSSESSADVDRPICCTKQEPNNSDGNPYKSIEQVLGNDQEQVKPDSFVSAGIVSANDNIGSVVNPGYRNNSTNSSTPSDISVTDVDNIGSQINQTSNQNSGSESSVPSYSTMTAVDETKEENGNLDVVPNPSVCSDVQSNHKGLQEQLLPFGPYTTMDSFSKTFNAQKGHDVSKKPGVYADEVNQQKTGKESGDQSKVTDDAFCDNPVFPGYKVTKQMAGRECGDHSEITNGAESENPGASADKETQQTGRDFDHRPEKDFKSLCQEPDMSANVTTKQTRGGVDRSAVNNDTTHDKPGFAEGIVMGRLDRLQEDAVQNSDYATLAQVGFLAKPVSQDSEVTKF